MRILADIGADQTVGHAALTAAIKEALVASSETKAMHTLAQLSTCSSGSHRELRTAQLLSRASKECNQAQVSPEALNPKT